MSDPNTQQLVSELQTGNDRQRRAASYKLGKSKDPTAVNALIAACNDSDDIVRSNAIDSLRKIGSKEALDFVSKINNAILQEQNLVGSSESRPIETTPITHPVKPSRQKPDLPNIPETLTQRRYKPSGKCPPTAIALMLGGGLPGGILIGAIIYFLSLSSFR